MAQFFDKPLFSQEPGANHYTKYYVFDIFAHEQSNGNGDDVDLSCHSSHLQDRISSVCMQRFSLVGREPLYITGQFLPCTIQRPLKRGVHLCTVMGD